MVHSPSSVYVDKENSVPIKKIRFDCHCYRTVIENTRFFFKARLNGI